MQLVNKPLQICKGNWAPDKDVTGSRDAKVLPKTLPYKQHTSLKWTPVPWLGVLTLGGQYKNESIGLIPVVMISDKKGIADARSMASLNKYNWENIRNDTYVMFLTKKSKAWYAKVEKIILHPEYNEDTLTTIAFLNLEYDLKKMEGKMLRWPFRFSNVTQTNTEVFAIGYSNRSQIFEQILFRMDHVKLGECKAFYFVEDMGLSVWGPGCSLPARFVDFEPFVPWIMSNMETRRNYWQPESIGVRPEKFRDKWMLWRLTDTSLALRPLNLIGDQEIETVHGQCDDDNMRSDQLIYKEVTEFTTRRGLNRRAIKATAVYGLSLYDRNFNKTHYTCVQVVAKCSQKSDSKLEYSKGFEETDMFQPYVKILPVNPSSHQDVYPPYVHTIKDAWEKYEYEVIGTDITHLIFRFEFEVQGLIEVQFFGNRTDAYPPIETTTALGGVDRIKLVHSSPTDRTFIKIHGCGLLVMTSQQNPKHIRDRHPRREEQNEEKHKTRQLLIGGINGGISRRRDRHSWTRIGGKDRLISVKNLICKIAIVIEEVGLEIKNDHTAKM
ncbi:unnamed protein product [Arctia plantaginis]|uniref:Uncharacterized protein n=1 Tax=Arctia plantaginis TaxID=874455 RepID=A0A8S0Z282_ARCPL|nr:unnamed protein product [Arctia plantaginis]